MTIITTSGNLAADPELRFTPTGKPVATFTVIENRPRKTDSGEWEQDEPNVYRAEAWEALAENAAESLRKGDRVVFAGKVFTERWTDKETGKDRTAQKVRITDVGPSLRYATAQPVKTKTQQQ